MPKEASYTCDVLVIGGGIAAEFAAIKAAEAGADTVLVDKGYAGKSGQSPYADGFMTCDTQKGFDIDAAVKEVCKESEYLNNPYWTRVAMEHANARYRDLLEYGCVFTEGISQFSKKVEPYGMTLRKRMVKAGVRIVDQVMIVDYLEDQGRIIGAVGLPNDSTDLVVFQAKTTISCVGACGYKPLGYPALMQLTGDGEAMAYRHGGVLAGKEFVDGHFSKEGLPDPVSQRTAGDPAEMAKMLAQGPGPGGLGGPGGPGGGGPGARYNSLGQLISERPEGTSNYMFNYLQSEFEVHAGNGPIFNAAGARSYGGAALGMSVRKTEGLWPGDHECRSTIPGLFAAGDALGCMQNGAVYCTGGSAIGHGAVTGTIAAEAAAKEAAAMAQPVIPEAELARARAFVLEPAERTGGYGPNWAIQLLRNYMTPYFIYFIKKADRLEATLTLIEFMRDHISPMIFARDAHELRLAHEAKNMILNAEMRLRSALFRTESRGNHYREDYPSRDDENWLCWTTIRQKDGKMLLEKVPIPAEYHPDPALSYREKYPFPFPNEVISEA